MWFRDVRLGVYTARYPPDPSLLRCRMSLPVPIGLGCPYCCTLISSCRVERGLTALSTLQLFKVLPRLLQACLVSHLCRIVRYDKTYERGGP